MCLDYDSLNFPETNIFKWIGYQTELFKYSPTGLVPALINDSCVVHDSLAIAEYVNEISKGQLYPVDTEQRAVARSLCAELHTGFFQLRNNCPFTLDKVTTPLNRGEKIMLEISRVEAIFSQAKLPFMYDSAGVVDTFYAVLAFRLNTYGIKFEGSAGRYQESSLSWNILEKAISQAKTWRNK